MQAKRFSSRSSSKSAEVGRARKVDDEDAIASHHEHQHYCLDQVVQLEEGCQGNHTENPSVDKVLRLHTKVSIEGTDIMAMRAQMKAFLPKVARARRVERRRRLSGSCGNSSAMTIRSPTARRSVAEVSNEQSMSTRLTKDPALLACALRRARDRRAAESHFQSLMGDPDRLPVPSAILLPSSSFLFSESLGASLGTVTVCPLLLGGSA
ncbi:hypothetical protein E2C01_021886 [Portunus trituberculatus]|uniref:Uncharacterized protein n=1 Tax=Portunus trituberculatus TaxID=210409 RepID=A0A5B7E643_PORTR|nr:hypothetical protein [Portunus trituberculatus]